MSETNGPDLAGARRAALLGRIAAMLAGLAAAFSLVAVLLGQLGGGPGPGLLLLAGMALVLLAGAIIALLALPAARSPREGARAMARARASLRRLIPVSVVAWVLLGALVVARLAPYSGARVAQAAIAAVIALQAPLVISAITRQRR